MKSTNWTFRYSTARLHAAAKRKYDHHKARLEAWQQRLLEVEKDMKENGLTIPPPAPPGYTTGIQGLPQYDPNKLKAVQEAQGKVASHQKDMEIYGRWVHLFDHAVGIGEFEVDYDDAVFFGLDEAEA